MTPPAAISVAEPDTHPPPRRAVRPGVLFGRLLLWTLGLALVAFAAWVLVLGISSGYYLLPFDARPEHPLHHDLRPGGSLGVLLATVGTALMCAMQLYTVRKMLPIAWPIGSPAWWLRFHILCGVLGPVLIVLHSGLYLPTGLVAVAFWCMVLVSLSGGFGRYVYGQFPRNAAGTAMSFRSASARLSELKGELVALTGGVDADRIGEAVTLARDVDLEVHGIPGLVRLDLEVRRRAREVRHLLASSSLPRESRRTAVKALVAQLKLKRSIHGWQVTQRLFRYWHLFHEPLAKAMYLIAAWHIFTALAFGGALKTLLQWIP